jgi:hypothetical protein
MTVQFVGYDFLPLCATRIFANGRSGATRKLRPKTSPLRARFCSPTTYQAKAQAGSGWVCGFLAKDWRQRVSSVRSNYRRIDSIGINPAGALASTRRSKTSPTSARASVARSAVNVTTPPNAKNSPPLCATRQPRYPSCGGRGRTPAKCGIVAHRSLRAVTSPGRNIQEGSGRPA